MNFELHVMIVGAMLTLGEKEKRRYQVGKDETGILRERKFDEDPKNHF